ncbi:MULTISPECIES: type IA DNA topoisomerase [Burkholderia cepacia complex]|uniref:Type IA DNA topoisomerase n=1 Tax=Burkholderia contaminans TaxID=488447 RepID=A0A2S5DM98_9BURK|nr:MULTISPECIES: type IA DNA topoisomerase [Burkholderia cepacia complex]KVR89493.1 hypothetical protein WK28_24085 [Burkholderia vietnamiensis]POZ80212.1 type IA DNA topoisomerase [Burkholderia contaminans]HDR9131985.1 type IA DNA topoisomerase [Burkholderia vietnamiensis]
MQDTIVFVVEKPFIVRELAHHLSARWPRSKVYAITTLYVGLYEFRYPRGLGLSAFPYVGDPSWKPRPLETTPVWEIHAGLAARIDQEPAELLRAADAIWYAADPDPSGAVAYHVLLTQCLGEAAAVSTRPALRILSLDDASVEAEFDAGATTSDAWFVACRNAGLARRFFDFNFNTNSLALFGAALRSAGVKSEYAVSKYSLQLLYKLRKRPAYSEGELLCDMEKWIGTGRYAPSPLGSPASRATILEGLQLAGLIAWNSDGRIVLTELGQTFLQRLHPDCLDADLPARIGQWESAWPASRPNVERYLRTFFGKQKRFVTRESA